MGNKRGKSSSWLVTVVVLCLLLLAGPSQAITIGMEDVSTGTDASNRIKRYQVTVDLHTNERIPLTFLAIDVVKGATTENCYFNITDQTLDTGLSSDATLCGKITITNLTKNSIYEEGTRFGYGYGSNGIVENVTFNPAGYGYGYNSGVGEDAYTNTVTDGTGEIVYEFTMSTGSGLSNGATYTLRGGVSTGADSITHTYYSEETVSFRAPSSGSSGGGGSSSSFIYGTTPVDEGKESLDTELELSLTKGENYTFTYENYRKFVQENHSIQIVNYDYGGLWTDIILFSDPIKSRLYKSQPKTFDITGNGVDDIKVLFRGLINNQVDIIMQNLQEPIPAPEIATEPTGPIGTDSEGTDSSGSSGLTQNEFDSEFDSIRGDSSGSSGRSYLWIWIVVFLLIIVGTGYAVRYEVHESKIITEEEAEIKEYFDFHLQRGRKIEEIKNDFKDRGWTEDQLDDHMNFFLEKVDHKMHAENFKEVQESITVYFDYYTSQGRPVEEIKKDFYALGWTEEMLQRFIEHKK